MGERTRARLAWLATAAEVRVRAAGEVPVEQAIVWRRGVHLSTADSLVTEPVTCTGPAEFTGNLISTDHEVESERDPRSGAPPYRAWFRGRHGSGLPLTTHCAGSRLVADTIRPVQTSDRRTRLED